MGPSRIKPKRMNIRVTPPAIHSDQLGSLAIFPLPGVVLFPGALLPMQKIEPRYRQITPEPIEDRAPNAMTAPLTSPQQAGAGYLPVLPIAGVGSIVHHEELPDGRFHILLVGQGRIFIREELEVATPYRQVRAEWLQDEKEDKPELVHKMSTVRQVVFGLHRSQPKLAAALAKFMQQEMPPSHVADALANALFADPQDRQELLEDTQISSRLDRVLQQLLTLFEASGDATESVH